jgi:hypothetical protein
LAGCLPTFVESASSAIFSAPRDDTARASCGNGAKANSYHYHFDQNGDGKLTRAEFIGK